MNEETLRHLELSELLSLLRKQVDAAINILESGGMVQGDKNYRPEKFLVCIGDFEIHARFKK